jgi:hypothetical protein
MMLNASFVSGPGLNGLKKTRLGSVQPRRG